ncbi:MAG: hypothetical protein JWO38_3768 [Gemmataceae bacterium]|nr:hypothetical protein [Gemmataceae bacterium]
MTRVPRQPVNPQNPQRGLGFGLFNGGTRFPDG